ncbi:MAG: hypothetical protein HY560_06680 [Gemmatimonadetes bacterium]|nr:hypothetical protein [Gemmatimonadota bacterium]
MIPRVRFLLALLASVSSTLTAQQRPDTARAADSSLAARLERAERMIQILQEQVAEQARTRVEPGQGNRIELSGLVLINGFFNNAKANNADLPTFVLPPDPPGGFPIVNVGGTARQTELTLTARAPSVLRASFTGEVDLDFYGGHLSFARLFPLAHLKRTRAELRWPHAWAVFGAEAPPISDLNPSSFAARSIPGFTSAGNLWFWIPQLRFGIDAGRAVRVGLEAAALAPVSPEQQATFSPDPSRAERSRRPFGQARLLLRWDRPGTTGEIGIGGHYGWLATTARDTSLVSRAAAVTARVTIADHMDLRVEAFAGQALASLGGGGIGQNLGLGDVPVRTRGGWAQLNIRPTPQVEFGGGYGFDDPDDADLDVLATTTRLKNVSWEGHLHLRPGPLVVAIEFRRIQTTYAAGVFLINHLNLATGFRF